MYAVSSAFVRRVDRRGRAAGAHDRQVGQDPLEAGARRDADPLLGLEAQREQAGGQLLDPLAGLLPGHRRPQPSPSG